MPEALSFCIRLHQGNHRVVSPGEAQVVEGDLVDGEHRRCGTKLGAHVADGGAVCEGNLTHPGAVELDELPDHTVLAKHLGDGEHHVGRGHTRGNAAGEFETHHSGNQHRHGLTQHGRFRFDTSHTPAEHTQAVDHGGVRVGADNGVREGLEHPVNRSGVHHFGEVFNVDLVDDAGSWRNNFEVVERGLAPAQELVALTVSLVLDFDVSFKGVFSTKKVGNYRVVDDQLCWRQRIDPLRVTAKVNDCFAHGGEVDDAGNTGEVLKNDPCRCVLNFGVRLSSGIPVSERSNLCLGDVFSVFGAQQVFEKHFQRKRQTLRTGYRIDAVDLMVDPSHREGVASVEAVESGHETSSDLSLREAKWYQLVGFPPVDKPNEEAARSATE